MKNIILPFCLMLLGHAALKGQFKNSSFDNGSTASIPHTIQDWTNNNTQWVPQNFVKYEDPFIDLTGTGFGNGYSIEQKIYTTKGKKYKIAFDLGTFFGWDLWDAGVTVSLDGVALGNRIFHNTFTNSRDTFMYWKRLSSIEFNGTGGYISVKITGNSELVQSYNFNSGPGVIGIDNIELIDVSTNGLAAIMLTDISIYPNPTSEVIRANQMLQGENTQYEIYAANGEKMLSGRLENASISVKDLAPGAYYLTLQEETGKRGTGMFMIQR